MLGAATVDASTSSEAQTVAGTTRVHFGEVDQGVYKGSEPKTNADYEFLHARHIKYILDLELLPSVRHSEQKKAKRYGILLIHGRLNASPIPSSHKHIERIMAILRNKRYHPIYFHSKDRLAGHQQEIHAERDRKLEAARRQRHIRRQQAA
jgi:hypothetical protein